MRTSNKGVVQIEAFEGTKLYPYQDTGGKWTVGTGHLMVAGDGTTPGLPITQEKATELLKNDLVVAENAINKENLDLTQNEFDALVSFVFNLGVGAFQRSTLLKFLKQGNKEAAAKEFPKWNMVTGVVSKGLTLRRMAEQDCFSDGTYKA